MSLLRKLNRGESQRSSPHRQAEKVLDKMGISYTSEFLVPPFAIDIFIPEYWVGAEIDGPFHKRRRDEGRDEYLLTYYGIPIKRFNVIKGLVKTKFIAGITEFLEEHANTVTERRALGLRHISG